MSEAKNVAVDILRGEAARREVLIAELRAEAAELGAAADVLEKALTEVGVTPDPQVEAALAARAEQAWEEAVRADDVPKPQPPRERAFGPRVQHLSPADMPRPS